NARKRDGEFWYEDGNIILVACDVEFRIYKGLLAVHSPIFSDMFNLPQPTPTTTPDNTHDPTQPAVVHMTDSPEDLRHILRACMPRPDSRFVSTTTREKPDFHAISAYARLGHKYEIDHLLNQALEYLKDIYTDDFDKWTNIPKAIFNPHAVRDATSAISVVNIARLTGCLSILPAALAVCCTLEERLVDGFLREDGIRDHLDVADVRHCIRGLREIRIASGSATLGAFFPYPKPGPNCTDVKECSRSWSATADGLHKQFPWLITIFPFRTTVFAKPSGVHPICSACIEAVEKQIIEERRKVWRRLPELLGMKVLGWGGGN
ncbi:hypothetical protein C8Q80DRAFT_1108932, partial [Daedaleopsis nitida]